MLLPAYEKIAPRTVAKDTLGAFVTRLAALPLNFEPGTAWHYGASGNGLAVVGRLVEVISGLSLDQFLSERILRPLKMNDTLLLPARRKAGPLRRDLPAGHEQEDRARRGAEHQQRVLP